MPSRSLIIFGASGRTGSVLAALARSEGYSVLSPSHSSVPLEDTSALSSFILAHPEAVAVINCAAISGLEACLDDALHAHAVNAVAPATMALACRVTGARLIHLSTDYVLDGRRAGLKDELCRCRPVCVYGESKLEGELQVLDILPSALVLRVSWVCGNPAFPSLVEQVCAKALAGEAVAAIGDKWSLPSFVGDVARACLALIERSGCWGVVHVCADEAEGLSWFDCAQLALSVLQERGELSEMPVVERQLLKEVKFFRDERPRYTAMCCARLVRDWGVEMQDARSSIRSAVDAWLLARG